MTYREPIAQNPRREIAIGIGTGKRESDTSLLGKDFPLSPEADNRGRNPVAVLRLFQDFTQRGEMCNACGGWGIPLIDIKSSNRSLQERGLYFSV
ncbi:hypothetical protein QUB47_17025 [Microcoleus sp. AT9_B5]